jgi:hypothetical protein
MVRCRRRLTEGGAGEDVADSPFDVFSPFNFFDFFDALRRTKSG